MKHCRCLYAAQLFATGITRRYNGYYHMRWHTPIRTDWSIWFARSDNYYVQTWHDGCLYRVVCTL